jgi:MFS family permease
MNNADALHSYSTVLSLAGVRRLVVSAILGRTANQMSSLALILFSLRIYHSALLAGAVVLVQLVAVPVGPLAGALVDRLGSSIMIAIDFVVTGAIAAVIAALAWAHLLPEGSFVLLVLLGTITWPFSASGIRALLPQIVPPHLWDRANALDSVTQIVATIAGPLLAGTLFGWLGAVPAMLGVAVLYLGSAVFVLGLRGTRQHVESAPVFGQALSGLHYFFKNPQLRGLAVAMVPANVSFGVLVVAIPVLTLRTLHQAPGLVGWIWAVIGVSSLVSALLLGRVGTKGRERTVLIWSMGLPAPGLALAAAFPSLGTTFFAAALVGVAAGPADVALFSLRQRSVHPSWYGRAIAVSMTLNSSGGAIGGGLGGVLSQASPPDALFAAGVFALIGAAGAAMIPRQRSRTTAPVLATDGAVSAGTEL